MTAVRSDPWHVHAMRIAAIRPEAPGVATYDLTFVDSAGPEAYRARPASSTCCISPASASRRSRSAGIAATCHCGGIRCESQDE